MVNIDKLLEQAQEMQDQLSLKMEELEVEGSAGGGIVTLTMNGKKTVLSVKIGKDAVDSEDMTILEDLIMAAVNDAAANVDRELSGTLAGNLPPGFPTS
jgi:DNA-binding YbaB/EbfC family protein